MKWVTLISFIFLFSSATSRNLQRVARDADHKSEIAHRYNDLKEETFKAVAMITFAQYLQRCSYDGLSKLVKDVVDLAQKCVANEDAPECSKSLPSIFLDEICQVEKLRDSYGAMADCCAKSDPERNGCFLSFKIPQPDFVQPYQRPASDVICKEYEDNRVSFLGHFIYSVARRNPFLYAPTILGVAADYEHALKSCCKESDVGACLDGKETGIREKVKKISVKQQYSCGILKKFGDRIFQADKLALLSQKYPKASFAEISKLIHDVKDVYKECCEGDMVECMDDRAELVNYMCSKHEAFSSKIKDCCEKPIVERSQCIMEAEFDEKPADLPSLVEKYIQDKEVCKSFEAGHDAFMSEFVYEYSRRHPEFSTQLILRIAKGYETLLEKCCKTDNPAECYANAQDQLNEHIKETQDVVKTNCDLLTTHGEADFLKALLIRYTKKMPQVSTETLLEIGKKMTGVGTKCCKLPEDRRLPCSEGYLSMVIQDMCRRQETSPINDNVSHCCSDSYAYRRPCFSAMGVDTKYVPPPFNPDVFNFDEKLCSAPAEERAEGQMKLLINLIKRKPQMTEEQIKTIADGFTAMVDKCCKQSDIETCFGEEGANLIVQSRATLGIGA
ncbi:serum albumin precursor [Anas platyrhynchos]|uniref:Albumin n=1 Tax=Anas platyrhynchos TaxID=8839 RepID=I6U3L8_ANAPL|nr:serum albumin precursor [Anas platyrhynchos]AFN07714.1 albumin [Anas platyrhynchos]|eukprot:NP_001297323.1 serum albumin precursor [Anas platyrhynchos]